jgi:hypothetical protein
MCHDALIEVIVELAGRDGCIHRGGIFFKGTGSTAAVEIRSLRRHGNANGFKF